MSNDTQRRPHYSQRHPAMSVAQNIVNQILDEAGTDALTRQRINDACDQFTAWLLEQYADRDDEQFCGICFAGTESSEHHEKCITPLERAATVTDRLRDLHTPGYRSPAAALSRHDPRCEECAAPWPCPTLKACEE